MSVSGAVAPSSDPVAAARAGLADVDIVASVADRRAAANADPERLYLTILTLLARLGAGALLAGLAAAFLAGMQAGLTPVEFASTILAAGVVGIAAFRFAVEREWRRRLARALPERQDAFRFQSDADALTFATDDSLLRLGAPDLRRIDETPHHLIVVPQAYPARVIPKAAFARAEIATALADYWRERIARAHGTPFNRDLP